MSGQDRSNSISSAIADKLISAHDGDVALLYIYMVRRGGHDLDAAARDLCRTMSEISAAAEKLQRMGLMPDGAAPAKAAAKEEKLPPPDEIPQYRSEDIVRRCKENGEFAVVVAEAQTALTHTLSSVEMKTLFGIYDYLALPPEVIMMLINYCVARCREQSTPDHPRRPSMRNIEKEAYNWVHQEILTLDQAEDYIRRQRERRDALGRAKAAVGVHGRELTPTETKYLSAWLDMGFDEDALAIGYDRTITNTGALKWSYMNKIMQSWHEKGLHSAEEIESGDPRRRPQQSAAQGKAIDMDELQSVLEKI